MFPLFPRRKRKPLRFPALEASGLEDQYFYRTSRYMRTGEVWRVLNTEHNPTVIPLTLWEALVFEHATGVMTVGQFVRSMADRYQKASKSMPKELDKVLLKQLETMTKDRLILELSETPVELPYYLDRPMEKQDQNKARKLMDKDRFKD